MAHEPGRSTVNVHPEEEAQTSMFDSIDTILALACLLHNSWQAGGLALSFRLSLAVHVFIHD